MCIATKLEKTSISKTEYNRSMCKMIKLIVASLMVFNLVVGARSLANEIRHLQLDNADLIETSPANYGLSVPILWQNNWKTVSVDGNNVLIYGQNCQLSTRQFEMLAPEERAMLASAKQQFASMRANNLQMPGAYSRSGFASYSMQAGQTATSSSGRNMNTFSFNSNGYSITRHDDDNFSVSRPDLPYNANRIFVDGDTVTFVYNDGRVLMRPANCLDANERQLIAKLNTEIQQAEQQFHANMQQMNQNMQQMQQSMRQSFQQNMQGMRMRMQNLRQNLNGMFQQQPSQRFNYGPSPMRQQQYYQGHQTPSYATPQSTYGNPAGGFANGGANFPFGPNNSPFGPGFPFSNS